MYVYVRTLFLFIRAVSSTRDSRRSRLRRIAKRRAFASPEFFLRALLTKVTMEACTSRM